MSDPQSGNPDREAFERGRATARSMSDNDLFKLHAQGASAFRAGAWEVLDAEVSRRQRVRDRQSAAPHVDENDRYPALRITVVLVKVSAAVMFIATVLIGILYAGTNALAALGIVVVGVLATISYWAGAELLVVLMDIEANTRFLRRDEQ